METIAVLLIKKLGLMDLALFIKKNNTLKAYSMAKTSQVQLIKKLLPQAFNKITFLLDSEKTKDNILVKSLKEKVVKLTYNLYDLALPLIPKLTTKIIIQLSGFKSGLIIFLIDKDESLGVIVFTKNYKDNFSQDQEILFAFARNITKTIINTQKYQNLLNQIKDFKI